MEYPTRVMSSGRGTARRHVKRRMYVRSRKHAMRSIRQLNSTHDKADLRAWKYATLLNLDYPNLRVIHRAPHTGAPICVVPDFLSAETCAALIAKFHAGAPIAQDAAQRAIKTRTSTHVRLVKRETARFHAMVAALTNHHVDNMETVKVVRYTRADEFNTHSDAIRMPHVDDYRKHIVKRAGYDAHVVPPYVNREMTLFVYLNDTRRGGETAFYRNGESRPYLAFRPTQGMAVVFYPTLQPIDEACRKRLPQLVRDGHIEASRRPNVPRAITAPSNATDPLHDPSVYAYCTDDMRHAGCPAADTKYLLAQWIWAPYVDRDKSLPSTWWHSSREARPTDGRVV